jgi:hypothetical protein
MAWHLLPRAAHGVSVRTMTESREFEPLSPGGGRMVDDALFQLLLELEMHKAQRLRYTVSIVCLTMEQSGAGNGQVSDTSIAEGIAVRLRGTDVVAMRAEGLVLCLLVDAETAHLPSILERLTTWMHMASWSAGGSSYPRTATRAEDMVRQAIDLHTRARNEGGNRLYIAS